jgi:hypothetical protein
MPEQKFYSIGPRGPAEGRVHETSDGSGPGGADMGGSGATVGLGLLDTDVDAGGPPDVAYETEPMEQLTTPPLLLLQGAMECGGIPPRPIMASGPDIGCGPPIPCDIMPGGGPPPFRCMGWWPFMWCGPIGPPGPMPFMGGQGPPIEGGQAPPFIGFMGRSCKKTLNPL